MNNNDDQEHVPDPSLDGAPQPESAEDLDALIKASLLQVMTTNPTVVLDALIAALRHAKEVSQVPKEQFHFVLVPDAEEATIKSVGSFEELLALWRETHGQPVQAFGFRGDVLLPSRGGHYLVTPWGRYPIFAEDRDTEIDPRGYLGPATVITKQVPATAAAVPGSSDADDELSEEEDEVIDDDVDDQDDDEGLEDDDEVDD